MELAEHSALDPAGGGEELEEYDEGEGYDEQYDEGDDDFAAEAEEMARRLQDQCIQTRRRHSSSHGPLR